jgi:glutaredoxin-related protein
MEYKVERRKFLQFLQKSLIVGVGTSLTPVFATSTNGDYILSWNDFRLLKSIKYKLHQVLRIVGYGNFNLITFDETLNIAKKYSLIQPFTKAELDFIDKIFYTDAREFGFYGTRTVASLTNKINKKDTYKVPHTGHYLYKHKPLKTYRKMLIDIGNTLILTSGIRSVVKQMYLFFSKIEKCNGNVSIASHSLAPMGYSFHSVGDFDVGKKGLGYKNFTKYFATTKEFRDIRKLKYIGIRYTVNNFDGVRYEPWHIKIV